MLSSPRVRRFRYPIDLASKVFVLWSHKFRCIFNSWLSVLVVEFWCDGECRSVLALIFFSVLMVRLWNKLVGSGWKSSFFQGLGFLC